MLNESFEKKVEMLFTMNLRENFVWFFWPSVLFLHVNTFVKMQVGKIRE